MRLNTHISLYSYGTLVIVMRHSTFLFIIILTLLIKGTCAVEASSLPEFGDPFRADFPIEKEHLLGNALMQQLYASDCLVSDPIINEYLQNLGTKLSQQANIKDYKLHFFGIEAEALNAFAFFGGHVAVHTGLIQSVKNESELAAVLAHETAHISQRHLLRMVANNRRLTPLTLAQILAATAVGVMGSADAGAHLTVAALAGHVQQLINYTREHEKEADSMGIQILAKAGFDPNAMATVFEGLHQSTLYHAKLPEYLRTHPLDESRIAAAQNRAEQLPYKQTKDSLFFHLIRARLELYRKERDIERVRRLKEKLTSGKYQNKMTALYAYALALAKNRQYQEAIQILKELEPTEQSPNQWIISLSLAEVEQESGNTQAALKRLKYLFESYPNNYPIIIKYAENLVEAKQGIEARTLLLKHQKYHSEVPEIYQLLARAQSLTGHKVELHQSQAEWHYLRGEFKDSFQQLDLALEQVKENSVMAHKIKTRKRALQKISHLQGEL